KGLPKADSITFKPVPESQSRLNGLQGGDFDIIQTSSSLNIDSLKELQASGDVKVNISDKGSETAYLMLNVSKAPFNDPIARKAVAYGGDAREVNPIRNKGLNTIATGPFPPDNAAYIPERPVEHNLKKAKQYVKQYADAH